jgi:hypothetical protein
MGGSQGVKVKNGTGFRKAIGFSSPLLAKSNLQLQLKSFPLVKLFNPKFVV